MNPDHSDALKCGLWQYSIPASGSGIFRRMVAFKSDNHYQTSDSVWQVFVLYMALRSTRTDHLSNLNKHNEGGQYGPTHTILGEHYPYSHSPIGYITKKKATISDSLLQTHLRRY